MAVHWMVSALPFFFGFSSAAKLNARQQHEGNQHAHLLKLVFFALFISSSTYCSRLKVLPVKVVGRQIPSRQLLAGIATVSAFCEAWAFQLCGLSISDLRKALTLQRAYQHTPEVDKTDGRVVARV